MGNADEFLASLTFDEEGQVLWPEETKERERYAEGLFGSAVVQGIASVADEMLSRVDGRWPKPGSMNYAEEIKVAEIFRTMSAEQKAAVQDLVSETARLAGYSIFLGLEHLGSGNVRIQVLPINRGKSAGEAVSVTVGEWNQAYLSWEERFR